MNGRTRREHDFLLWPPSLSAQPPQTPVQVSAPPARHARHHAGRACTSTDAFAPPILCAVGTVPPPPIDLTSINDSEPPDRSSPIDADLHSECTATRARPPPESPAPAPPYRTHPTAHLVHRSSRCPVAQPAKLRHRQSGRAPSSRRIRIGSSTTRQTRRGDRGIKRRVSWQAAPTPRWRPTLEREIRKVRSGEGCDASPLQEESPRYMVTVSHSLSAV